MPKMSARDKRIAVRMIEAHDTGNAAGAEAAAREMSIDGLALLHQELRKRLVRARAKQASRA